ncbi:MAG: sigma-70 family RNA polymerase sigma factor, partial [Phycisphaerae bacterium]|nr:sigma-70 family RNA polymerase sigma factor [Phycisphaerae bacterium]
MASSENNLAVRARTDREAFGRLYERYYPGTFGYCVHRLFGREAAEDVTSTVFLQVARHIRRFKGSDEQDLRNWIYTIATNQVNAHIRKTKRRKRLFEDACRRGGISVRWGYWDRGADESDWSRLYGAIARLKPRQQDAITMRYFEGLSPKEISGVL